MINKSDFEFIKESFQWAIWRMYDLPALQHWGSEEMKMRRIRETEVRQQELLQKLQQILA